MKDDNAKVAGMTKEEVIATIKECAERLGHAPSLTEILSSTKVTKRSLRRLFCNYTLALRACGLERTGAGFPLSLETLCASWVEAARRLGKTPTVAEYELHSGHSARALTSKFRSWNLAPRGVAEYAAKAGRAEEWKDVLEIIAGHKERRGEAATSSGTAPETTARAGLLANAQVFNAQNFNTPISNLPIYGTPLVMGAMLTVPTNEAGVMFLFASMAKELGYAALKVQTGFPDCIALRKVDHERSQLVRIEAEYESKNFLTHLHDIDGCDMILCWRHNWPECPLEVLELSKLVNW